MITIFGIEVTTIADAPAVFERTLKSQYKVNDLGVLSLDEKVAIIHKLDQLGLFAFRGGAAYCAKLLDLSRTTVYKHIKQ